jgi:DNA-binding PadR family transcriptional regulator
MDKLLFKPTQVRVGVLRVLLEYPDQLNGLAIARKLYGGPLWWTGSADVHPALMRLETVGWVTSRWDDRTGYPRKRLYRIAPEHEADALDLVDQHRAVRSLGDRTLSAMAFSPLRARFYQRELQFGLNEHHPHLTAGPWFVTEEDLVGGWAVRTVPESPSTGHGVTIADFMRREDAEFCVAVRNGLVLSRNAPAGVRGALTSDMAIDKNGWLWLKSERKE